jgi:hypothetical protein
VSAGRRRSVRTALRAPIVVTLALGSPLVAGAACGGEAFSTESTGGAAGAGGSAAGSGGDAGSGGAAGAGATSGTGGASGASGAGSGGDAGAAGGGGEAAGAGEAGTAGGTLDGGGADAPSPDANGPACPAQPPGQWDECPPEVALSGGCAYSLACQGGQVTLVYQCSTSGYGTWQIVPQACQHLFDSCPGTDVNCWGGTWQMPEGTNPPPPCPPERPALGDACAVGFGGSATCGYRCQDGTGWTVASCSALSSWILDGECPGDCSLEEAALIEFVAANKSCVDKADCKIEYVACSATREHCSGAFYVNVQTDPVQLGVHAEVLSSCVSMSGGSCWGCGAPAPSPDCVYGRCQPGTI